MNTGLEQGFACVYVADTDHDSGIHDERLYGNAAAACTLPKVIAIKSTAERLGPQLCQQRMDRAGLTPEQ